MSQLDSASIDPSTDAAIDAITDVATCPIPERIESFDEAVEHALISVVAPPIPEAIFARGVHLKSVVHDSNIEAIETIETITTTFGAISESSVLRNMLADVGDYAQDIPVTIADPPLRIIINFCDQLSKHHDAITDFTAGHNTVLVQWQRDFMMPYKDNYPLLESILDGANYLDIQQLLNLTAFTIADLFHGKTAAQLRAIMGITDPGFTAAQICEIEEENAWLRDLDQVGPH